MAKSKRGYLEPKVGDPDLMRKGRNGQAINPPTYMNYGGFTSAGKLNTGEGGIMGLERGGPQAKQGKPI